MAKSIADEYDFLFYSKHGELTEEAIEAIRSGRVKRYRVKEIKSGPAVPGGPEVLEVEIYPIWDCNNAVRENRGKPTTEAQREVNKRNAEKTLFRKMECNFIPGVDLYVTLSYKGRRAPKEEQAYRDIANFIRRVKRYLIKHGLPELKYIYVTEFEGPNLQKVRIHHHVIMSGTGLDEKTIKHLWGKGRVHCRLLEPDEKGFIALTKYVLKTPHGNGGKRWRCSQNLIDPEQNVSETHIGRRRAERMASDMEESASKIFSKRYGAYELIDVEVHKPTMDKPLPGVYIYAKMYKPGKEKKRRKWWWWRR